MSPPTPPSSTGTEPGAEIGGNSHGYRGRVRTGCLTCRARKVRCDEARPACRNCTRLLRDCVYGNRPRKKREQRQPRATSPHRPSPSVASSSAESPELLSLDTSASRSPAQSSDWSLLCPDILPAEVNARLERALQEKQPRGTAAALTKDGEDVDVDAGLGLSPGLGAGVFISRDIELTTTMDLLTANRLSQPTLFAYFLDTVDCPGITPFDSTNWKLAKYHTVHLAGSHPAIALSVGALAALLKAITYVLSRSGARAHYASARIALQQMIGEVAAAAGDDHQSFGAVLVASFLLCVFELLDSADDSTAPTLREPGAAFLSGLKAWAHGPSWRSSTLSIRLVVWLRVLHATTLRGGRMGLIGKSVYDLLPSYSDEDDDTLQLPSVVPPPNYPPEPSAHLYELLSGPLTHFYFQLQFVSGQIAQLTHYHRSRTQATDQDEVAAAIGCVKEQLRRLWEGRSGTQRQTAQSLQEQLAPAVASRVVELVRLCDTAYHAEMVEMDRVLGDPVSRWTDSRPSRRAIRAIVDAECALRLEEGHKKLSPGFLRPLFLYAIECMDEEQSGWAVDVMARVGSPLYRSDFWAAFAAALSGAQVQKERRVTSKFFCISHFGVAPPFL